MRLLVTGEGRTAERGTRFAFRVRNEEELLNIWGVTPPPNLRRDKAGRFGAMKTSEACTGYEGRKVSVNRTAGLCHSVPRTTKADVQGVCLGNVSGIKDCRPGSGLSVMGGDLLLR